MRTSRNFFWSILILFLFVNMTFASSVWFVNPTNNQIVYDKNYSNTTIPVNLRYSTNSYVSHYVKLRDHNGNIYNSNNGIPQWWYLAPGTYTWKLELYEVDGIGRSFFIDDDIITFQVKNTINIRNNFNIGNSSITIDGNTDVSGTDIYKFPGEILSLGAINQEYSGNTYVWKINGTEMSDWRKKKLNSENNIFLSKSKNYNYTVSNDDNGAIIVANLRVHTLPSTPTISMSGGFGANPTLTFSGGGSDVDHFVLKKEYDFGTGFNANYVNPSSNPYTDANVTITKFGGDLIARYSAKAVDIYGYESSYSSTVSTNGNSMWKQNIYQDGILREYKLKSNYPNPFNPSTQISYQILKDGFVNLRVYNSLGQEIAVLVNQHQAAGKYSVNFDASNLPSGVYLYKLESGEFKAAKKMILSK